MTKLALISNEHLVKVTRYELAVPDESLLLSGMEGDFPVRSYFLVRADDTAKQNTFIGKYGFYGAFGMIAPEGINYAYFKIDTTRYQILTYEELFR